MIAKATTASGKPFALDWEEWRPRDICVLTFVQMHGRVLLIVKKRGLGAGKINAPGGHVERGETPLHAAVRETQEEVGITPLHLHANGVIRFAFADGYTELCHVFTSPSFIGKLAETDEASPFWCKAKEIPFGRMWEDDIHWIPRVLAEQTIDDAYIFDGDTLIWRNAANG